MSRRAKKGQRPSAVAMVVALAFLLTSFPWPALHAAGAFKPSSQASGAPIALFDPSNPSVSNWHSMWGTTPSGAVAKLDGKKMVVTGNLTNQSYGCVFMNGVEVDLDKTPYMEMEVESASHHWYLVLKGENLPNGYVKVQPDTDQTGPVQYDLRLAVGLTGKQTFSEVQLGVSTEESSSGNKGQTLVIKSFKLMAATEGGDSLTLYGPQNRRLGGWKNVNDDRSPSGVDIIISSESATLRCNRPSHSYGMMYKDVNMDLSKYSVLKFTIESVTHHWYLIMTQPEINKGYARIQPDSNLAGTFYYDLQDITGLSGIKNFRLQVGVSTHEEKPSALGETMTFKEIAFLSTDQVPPGAKVLKKKDLKFQQRIQAAAPKVFKTLGAPDPMPVFPAGNQPFSADPGPRRAPADLLRALGDEYAAQFTVPAAAMDAKEPVFTDKGEDLAVQNSRYSITFNKQNGAVKSIQIAGQSAPLITGSRDGALWQADTLNRAVLSASEFKKGNPQAEFNYEWNPNAKTLVFRYAGGKVPSQVDITFKFNATDTVDVQASVKSRSKDPFLSISLPQGLLFPSSGLDRVILPRLVGVAFKSNFFEAQKQWSDPYPSAFADYVWIGGKRGALSVYMVQPKEGFQPAAMEIASASGGQQGVYNHKIPVYIKEGQSWTSPVVRLSAGRPAHQVIRDYAKANGMDAYPGLKDKLPYDALDKFLKSIFIKVDQSANVDIAAVSQFLDEMPTPAIFHVAAFWPGGFDKNYPDYLPPDAEYGTLDDFKKLVAKARARGMLAMPYTNPTWWNDGPTLKKLTPDAVAVKNLDGSLLTEKYNGNPGIVVDPFNPKVVERNWDTVKEFTETVPMDFLFHDQIGARRWIYRGNAADPLNFTQGVIAQTARESKKIPLMTEGGFDRLVPYEIGFCGMTSMSYPAFKEYNDLWGEGNWEIDPISLYLAHDKVAFYHHNLSDDVLADTDAKLSWSMAYGFGLNVARTFIRQNLEKKWIALNDAVQKSVGHRILGQPLLGHLRVGQNGTWSRFGAMDVYANHSLEEPLAVGDHTIAPGGFLARAVDGDVAAGLFTRFNGAALEGRHYLIVKNEPNEIQVLQPDARTTFLSLTRPAEWVSGAEIHAFQLEKGKETEVPLSVDGQRLTFLYRADLSPQSYRIRYDREGRDADVELRSSAASLEQTGPLMIEAWVRPAPGRKLSDVKARLSSWKVGAYDVTPAVGKFADAEFVAAQQDFEGVYVARFKLNVPASFFLDAKYVWVRAQVEYHNGKQKVTKTLDRALNLSR